MACFCFGGKNAGRAADDAGARPLPPLEPIKYIILGPSNTGRRTLAKHLRYAAGFKSDSLSPEDLRRLRLSVQLSAAKALLLGARGGRVPEDACKELETAADTPLSGLVDDPEREKQFLQAAASFAKLDSVFRACSRPGNPALRDVATALFVFFYS